MHWIYHPEQEAKIVDSQAYYKLLEEGWYDTPAKFPSNLKEEEKEIVLEGLAGEESVKRRGRPPRQEQ